MTEKPASGRAAIEAEIVESENQRDLADGLAARYRAEADGWQTRANAFKTALAHFPEPAKRGRPATNGTAAPARKPRRAKQALGAGLGDFDTSDIDGRKLPL